MPITYTNRKGVTYTLCQGVTKTGKPRYYFSRGIKGEPVEAIPEGYEIRESVNGIVSLGKKRPTFILEAEVAAVKAAIQRHSKGRNYRVDVKPRRIDIYTLAGGDMTEAIRDTFSSRLPSGMLASLREYQQQHGRYAAELRFILVDEGRRLFRAERMCYRSSVDGWLPLHSVPHASAEALARRLIPTLDTDAFYELY